MPCSAGSSRVILPLRHGIASKKHHLAIRLFQSLGDSHADKSGATEDQRIHPDSDGPYFTCREMSP